MRLSKLTIRNFKAIDEVVLDIPRTDPERPGSANFLSLVGENNTAKSSVLEALRLVSPGTDIAKPTIDHFPGKKEENGPIEVELEFSGVDEYDEEEQGIRTHVYDGKYTVKKVWATAGANPTIWAFEPVIDFPTWPDPDTTRARFEDAGDDWRELIQLYEEQEGTFPNRTNKTVKANLKELAKKTGSPVAVAGASTWVENPGGFSAHVDSVLPMVIFVPAIQETKDVAAVTQKKSAARQIVEAIFATKLAGHPAIEKFTEAGEAVQKLFSGDESSEIVQSVENQISEKLSRLIDLRAELDFTPPDITADLAAKTELGLVDGMLKTKPEHQGHGAQRALILCLLELLAEDSLEPTEQGFHRRVLLLIEEPEIYLHPQMCRKMRDVLLTIARSETAQVICTTHSPVFLDLADRHDGIVIFRKCSDRIECIQRVDDLFGNGDAQAERSRLRMLLNFDPSVNEVFFTREVCLVEGDCEIASVDAVARRLESSGDIDWEKYLLARRELALVNCRGKWTIRAFQRVLNGFEIAYRVVHDADDEGEGGANAAIWELLNEPDSRLLIHDPNFEQQLFGEIWKKDKPWKAVKRITELPDLPKELIDFFTFALGKALADLS